MNELLGVESDETQLPGSRSCWLIVTSPLGPLSLACWKRSGHVQAHPGKRQSPHETATAPQSYSNSNTGAWHHEQDSLCLWPEVSSLTLKVNLIGFSLVWPGFYAHPQSWGEGEVNDIDWGGEKAVTQRYLRALFPEEQVKDCWAGKADSCPVQGIRAQLSCAQGSRSDFMLQVGLEEHRSNLGLRRVTVHAGELQVHGNIGEQFNSFLKIIHLPVLCLSRGRQDL